jgi:hypothetical protein
VAEFKAELEDVMQNQTDNSTSNVVSLFGNRKVAVQTEDKPSVNVETTKEGFFDAIKKNSDNEERLRKERLKANQSVLKSYRIKN